MSLAVTKFERDHISDYPSCLGHGEYVDAEHQNKLTTVLDNDSIVELLIRLSEYLGDDWADQPQLIQWLSLYVFENHDIFDFPSLNSPDDYYSIASSVLFPKGFERTEMYVDQFNGRVVDYFLNNERVTCIVSAEEIQILSFLNGDFAEHVFERTRQAKDQLEVYINSLF